VKCFLSVYRLSAQYHCSFLVESEITDISDYQKLSYKLVNLLKIIGQHS